MRTYERENKITWEKDRSYDENGRRRISVGEGAFAGYSLANMSKRTIRLGTSRLCDVWFIHPPRVEHEHVLNTCVRVRVYLPRARGCVFAFCVFLFHLILTWRSLFLRYDYHPLVQNYLCPPRAFIHVDFLIVMCSSVSLPCPFYFCMCFTAELESMLCKPLAFLSNDPNCHRWFCLINVPWVHWCNH